MSSKSGASFSTRDIAYIAMYLAIFYVLDLLSNQLPAMPQGGTIGLGTIALLLASYQLGWQKGLVTAVLSVLLQFLTGKMYLLNLGQFVLDYLIPFGVYGLASLFPNYKYFYSGVLITNAIRFVSAAAAGVLFWETAWWASCAYQAWYMVPTAILDLILVPILYKALAPYFKAKNIR